MCVRFVESVCWPKGDQSNIARANLGLPSAAGRMLWGPRVGGTLVPPGLITCSQVVTAWVKWVLKYLFQSGSMTTVANQCYKCSQCKGDNRRRHSLRPHTVYKIWPYQARHVGFEVCESLQINLCQWGGSRKNGLKAEAHWLVESVHILNFFLCWLDENRSFGFVFSKELIKCGLRIGALSPEIVVVLPRNSPAQDVGQQLKLNARHIRIYENVLANNSKQITC